MHSGQLIAGLEATVDKRMPLPDFMPYDDCAVISKQMMAERHPDLATVTTCGDALVAFCITFATIVAWTCAAEATRRASRKEEPCSRTASSTKSITAS